MAKYLIGPLSPSTPAPLPRSLSARTSAPSLPVGARSPRNSATFGSQSPGPNGPSPISSKEAGSPASTSLSRSTSPGPIAASLSLTCPWNTLGRPNRPFQAPAAPAGSISRPSAPSCSSRPTSSLMRATPSPASSRPVCRPLPDLFFNFRGFPVSPSLADRCNLCTPFNPCNFPNPRSLSFCPLFSSFCLPQSASSLQRLPETPHSPLSFACLGHCDLPAHCQRIASALPAHHYGILRGPLYSACLGCFAVFGGIGVRAQAPLGAPCL